MEEKRSIESEHNLIFDVRFIIHNQTSDYEAQVIDALIANRLSCITITR